MQRMTGKSLSLERNDSVAVTFFAVICKEEVRFFNAVLSSQFCTYADLTLLGMLPITAIQLGAIAHLVPEF